MQRIVITTLAAILIGGTAQAADYRYPDLVPPDTRPPYWEGKYFGANVGWGTGKFHAEVAGLRGSLDADGFFGGIHAGYNTVSGQNLYGVEADLEWSGISGGVQLAPGTGLDSKLNWFSTWRGRIGKASDNFLLYGTAGLALGRGTATASAGGASGSKSKFHIGWTVGAGVEMAINHELSARLEYLYADFGKRNYLSDAGIESKAGLRAHLMRVGLTAHF